MMLFLDVYDMKCRPAHIRFGLLEFWRLARWMAVVVVLPVVIIGGGAEAGDTIYFKDGMRTVCGGNAWEKNDEVHCEYEGGLLIYSKADVARIEKARSAEPETALKKNDEVKVKSASAPSATPAAESQAVSSPTPKGRGGIAFYDPRRPKKYWSSATRHHDTFRDAIAALAEEFNRPAQWVEENLGESNELNDVRENLAARISASVPSATVSNPPNGKSNDFYDPRRPKKYMTGADARHNSFKEAVDALAREFNKPADWVERHMGESNDIDQIRQNLKKAQDTELPR
jgi:hypothetical protein